MDGHDLLVRVRHKRTGEKGICLSIDHNVGAYIVRYDGHDRDSYMQFSNAVFRVRCGWRKEIAPGQWAGRQYRNVHEVDGQLISF